MELDLKKNMQDLHKRSLMLAENYHLAGDLNVKDSLAERIGRIKPYDIMRVGSKYLKKKNLVIMNVYGKPE